MMLLRLSVCFLSAIWVSGCAAISAINDPDELSRTLDKAFVGIPMTYSELPVPPGTEAILNMIGDEFVIGVMKDVAHDLGNIPDRMKIPLVIYMHGCVGLRDEEHDDIRFFVRNNYAVIAPDSFARKFRPKSCDPYTYTGGLFRDVLRFRLAEARYAHKLANTLPWVDKQNIFMVGFSEGGIATARYSRGGLAGRIILGWTCNSWWSEYAGISGPRDEPILAVVASNDPWFTHTSTMGDCGDFMLFRTSCESVVIDTSLHAVQALPEVRERILQFLEANRRP
jgi:hypothetical protein